MGRNERHYESKVHDNCSSDGVRRGCKDSDCYNKRDRQKISNRLRRIDGQKVVRSALKELD